jgi:Transposase
MAGVGALCTTSVSRCAIDLVDCKSFTPSITAPPAARTSTPTWQTWLLLVVTTPAGSSAWRLGWWWRTVCPTEPLHGTSGGITGFSSPSPRSKTGSRRLGKKSATHAETDYLDWALADFSGYLAADELYDGPFCVLSAVDARQQRRLLYEVLDHDPTQADILLFLARLQEQIVARGQTVLGITTDGSALYPVPISLAFGAIPHQICEFHVLKELTRAVLHVLARLRKRLAVAAPKLPRGRPKNDPEAQRLCRRARTLGQRVTALFEERYLFVRHYPTVAERATLLRLTRGQPQLRVLRAIMDEVYRLFDRRCRTDTALTKLAQLRQRVKRYRNLGKSLDKLHSPNLEKALTFLDDRLLPATSNAVERGNRRLRKMQKTVYRVRTQESLQGRLAVDLQRDQHASGRQETLSTLRETRE